MPSTILLGFKKVQLITQTFSHYLVDLSVIFLCSSNLHGKDLPLEYHTGHCQAFSLTSSGEEINYLVGEFGKVSRELMFKIF